MPYLGDIRFNYPPGTLLNDIVVFEVWDGENWVSSSEARDRVYVVEISS